MIYINSTEEFDNLIENNTLVVVDFTATWCGPCKKIGPYFDSLSQQFTSITFVKVDVDENEELVSRYEVSCMPTIMVIRNKEKVDEMSGAAEEQLKQMIVNNM
jgi:thioredoxin 1